MTKRQFGSLLICLGLGIMLAFGLRLAHALRRWGGPPRPQPMATVTDVSLIREWMTIPYIAHTYAVPEQALFDALGLPEKENRKKSLLELNQEYFPNQDGFVIERIQEAIRSFQAGAPLPPLAVPPESAPLP